MSVFAAGGAAQGSESGSAKLEHYEPVNLGDPDTPGTSCRCIRLDKKSTAMLGLAINLLDTTTATPRI